MRDNPLPDQWSRRTLRELATINYGRDPSAILSADGPYPVYGTSGSERHGTAYLYDGDSIVLGRKGTIDRIHYATGRFWTIDTAYFLSKFKEVIPKWLFYFLASIDLRSLNEATGVPSLSRDLLYKINVPTPPDTEQFKIAEILTTVDWAIEQTEALIAKHQRIKAGMMQDLLTRGVDERGNLRSERTHEFRDSPLGRIPVVWSHSHVGCHLLSIEQGWSPDCGSEPAPFGQWGVLKTTAVVWEGFQSHENKLLPSHLKPRPRYEVRTGDVLMTRGGPNSRVGVVTLVCETQPQLMLSDKLYRLVPKDALDPEYLVIALTSDRTQRHLSTLKTGLAESQTNISQDIVHRLLIPVPPKDEQVQIAKLVRGISNRVASDVRQLGKLRSLKIGLMQDLLTGNLRVTALLAGSGTAPI